MLYLLLPLIYINDLPDNLTTNAKLFADTSLFSVDRDITISSCDLNDDLKTENKELFNGKWGLIFYNENKLKKSCLVESLKNRLPSVIFSRGFREEISQGKTPVLPTIYNALSELISIMVVLFTIKLFIILFAKKLNRYNITEL